LNSVSLVAASACASNPATHTGVSASTTAASARSLAIRSALLPRVHPNAENPTIAMAIAPAIAPHTAGFTSGCDLIFVTVVLEKARCLLTTHSIKNGER